LRRHELQHSADPQGSSCIPCARTSAERCRAIFPTCLAIAIVLFPTTRALAGEVPFQNPDLPAEERNARGERRTGVLRLAEADLAYWDVARHAWTVEPGRVEVMVGRSSADADLVLRRTIAVSP